MIRQVIDLGYTRRGVSFSGRPRNISSPYSIVFVYTPNQTVVIKGDYLSVRKKIRAHYITSICCAVVYHSSGKVVEWWSNIRGITILKLPKNKYQVTIMSRAATTTETTTLSFRRIPRRWLPVYNRAISNYAG